MQNCEHRQLMRQVGTKFEFMTSYKEGKRPYICWDCGESFWVEPMVIRVLKPEASEAAAQPTEDSIDWPKPKVVARITKAEIEHNDH